MPLPRDRSSSTTAAGLAATSNPATRELALAVRARTVSVDGIRLHYREAGNRDAPAIVLLHGFPSSSHMFRGLIPRLAPRFHVIAPDYPGFGHSDMPAASAYPYTFDQLAKVVGRMLDVLGLRSFILYLHDYGGPIGLRVAVEHPPRIRGLVIQNANAYAEGLNPEIIRVLRPLWRERSEETLAPVRDFLTMAATRSQYVTGASHPEDLDPDAWTFDQALLDRPGNAEIQLALLADYGSNLQRYGQWQQYFRDHQPRTLVTWGRNDPFFRVAGALAYRRDLQDIRIVLLDGGHFLLEEQATAVAEEIIRAFAPPGQAA